MYTARAQDVQWLLRHSGTRTMFVQDVEHVHDVPWLVWNSDAPCGTPMRLLHKFRTTSSGHGILTDVLCKYRIAFGLYGVLVAGGVLLNPASKTPGPIPDGLQMMLSLWVRPARGHTPAQGHNPAQALLCSRPYPAQSHTPPQGHTPVPVHILLRAICLLALSLTACR